jgi:hypothetical protein
LKSHGAFPSKLPNLIATGTSIFAIKDDDSEVDHIISRYSRGRTTNTWQADITIQALEAFAGEVGSELGDPVQETRRRTRN